MRLDELKERALITADEVGNEAEYEEQLIEAINKVQNKLVVFARNKIEYLEVISEDNIIELPKDCFELVELRDSQLNIANFVKIDNSKIRVRADGKYIIKYKAFLPNVTKETEDEFEIEIETIAESCLVVGVASWIAVDNPELYDVLSAEYNNLLANLSSMPERVNDNLNGIERVGWWYW